MTINNINHSACKVNETKKEATMSTVCGKRARKQTGGNKYDLHRRIHRAKKDKRFTKTEMREHSVGEYKPTEG